MLFQRQFYADAAPDVRLRAAKALDLRSLAHLGDSVFELYERERQIVSTVTVEGMHNKVVGRVNSKEQARLLVLL